MMTKTYQARFTFYSYKNETANRQTESTLMKNNVQTLNMTSSLINRLQHRCWRRCLLVAMLRQRAAGPILALIFASLPGTSMLAASPTNTFYGSGAGVNITTGTYDSAFGYNALSTATNVQGDTAFGAEALEFNTAFDNTAFGYDALKFNTNGTNNTSVGWSALSQNTTGSENTATGNDALYSNTTGS